MNFNIGDKVRCKEGYLQGRDGDEFGGGSGYISGQEFTIIEITGPHRNREGETYHVLWGKETRKKHGVVSLAVEHVGFKPKHNIKKYVF